MSDETRSAGAEDDETQERADEPARNAPAYERSVMGNAWEANIKRTYDVYQGLSERIVNDALDFNKAVNSVVIGILSDNARNSSRGHQIADNLANQLGTVHANLQQTQVNATQTGPVTTKE